MKTADDSWFAVKVRRQMKTEKNIGEVVTVEEIYEKVRNIVETACKSDNNVYEGVWEFHVSPVTEYAEMLGRRLGADIFVVKVAALLHDYAAIRDHNLRPEHHTKGAEFAKEILEDMEGVNKEKIDPICHCILTHRGSVELERKTLEAEILATADAMSHFDMVHRLLWMAYFVKGLGMEDGKDWLLSKLSRSWSKMLPTGKEIVRPKKRAVEIIFGELVEE